MKSTKLPWRYEQSSYGVTSYGQQQILHRIVGGKENTITSQVTVENTDQHETVISNYSLIVAKVNK